MNRLIWLLLFLGVGLLTGCDHAPEVMTAEELVTARSTDFAKEDSKAAIEEGGSQEAAGTEEKADGKISVYVCGHVKAPGVYELEESARICDALALAGGVAEDGRPEALNQAEHMTDGQTLYVPGIDEAGETAGVEPEDDGLVDINRAGKEQLMTLPGIGESKAETIIQYREEHGAFSSIEGLMEIPGIKEGVFNKIKDKIKC